MYHSYFLHAFRLMLGIILLSLLSTCAEKGGDRISASTTSAVDAELTSLYDQTFAIFTADLDSSIALAQRAIKISQEHNIPEKVAKWKLYLGYLYRYGGSFSLAETHYKESLDAWEQLGVKKWIAATYEERGYCFLRMKKYNEALDNMRKALTIWEELDSTAKIVESHADLSAYFIRRDNLQMAKKEFQEAKKLYDPFPEKTKYLTQRVTRAQADVLLQEQKYEEAIQVYLAQNDSNNYANIGYIYKDQGDQVPEKKSEKARQFYLKSQKFHLASYKFHSSGNLKSELILDYLNLGGIKRRLGAYDTSLYRVAIDTLRKGISLAKQNKEPQQAAEMYRILSDTYFHYKKGDSAFVYHKKYKTLSDSMLDAQNARITSLAEVHYEKDRIEKENIQFEQDKELRETQLWVSLLLGALVAGLFLFYFYRYRSKKKLVEQQAKINSQVVVDLIKENTIENLNSRIEGQEQERERISRELHDHLGGTLAAVKLSLEGMEKELPQPLFDKYQHTHKLLQNATNETRTLSHEMKALPLQSLGLDDSLESLCKTLNMSEKINAHFNATHISPAVINQKSQLHLYRICQELLQNIIKHAQASHVFLQLTYDQHCLSLMVEDDGKGFEVNKAKYGLGMQNIQNRVAQINGKLDFDSSIGHGTTVIIEVPTE